MTNDELLILLAEKIKSGGSDTTAESLRDMLTEMIGSFQNLDKKDQDEGYLGIDVDGRVDVTKINSSDSATIKQVLQSDGTWKNQHSGRATFNGTGAQTKFTITHGGGFIPVIAGVTAGSTDAARQCFVDNFTLTQFDVTFIVAPIAGSGNVIINYHIE